MILKKYNFLLKPTWLVVELLVLLFTLVCFKFLSPWQLGKHHSVDSNNTEIATSLQESPLSFSAANFSKIATYQWKQVQLEGKFSPEEFILIRMRSYEQKPAYEVLNVFTTNNGERVMVDRGYIFYEDNNIKNEIAEIPKTTVKIKGYIRDNEKNDNSNEVVTINNLPQIKNINMTKIKKYFNLTDWNGYIQLEANQPGEITAIPLPKLDSGPYLSYGLQWIAFGLMVPLAFLYFVRQEANSADTETESKGSKEDILAKRYK